MVSETWRQLSLGEVATLQRGYDLPHRDRKPGTVPIISSSGSIDTHNESRVAGPGVVTGRYGTIGEVFFVSEDFWPLNTTLFVKDFKGNDPLFISFLLRTIDYHSYSGKSGVPGVNRNDLHEIAVSLPPLSEQRAIGATLSDVDALITSLDRLIAKKRDIKQATMQQLLTGKTRLPGFRGKWVVKKLGEITFINMGQSPDSKNYNVKGIGMTLIQGNADIENRKSISRVWTTQISKTCNKGDLIMTVRAPVGLIGIATEESCLGRGVCSLKCISDDNHFIFYSMVFLEGKWKTFGQGSTFASANSSQIAEFLLSIPDSIDEQQAISAVLSDMDAEITALEQKREKTRALKQGMMQELLTGKTRLL